MDDGKPIELVRDCPCLYAKAHSDFKDREKKKRAWLEDVRNLEAEENTAIKLWGNLRERFTKEIRGCRNTSGSGAFTGREWPLLESLQFLRPHIVPRPMKQSAPLLEYGKEIYTFCEPKDSNSPAQTAPVYSDSIRVDLSPVETATSTSRAKKRKASQLNEFDTTILESIKSFQEVCARKIRREEYSGEISGFSTMICDKNKKCY